VRKRRGVFFFGCSDEVMAQEAELVGVITHAIS
jgi:hypothetical protein